MEHSISKVRCSTAAFLLAAGITIAACGDDSGGTTPTPPGNDAGGFDAGGGTTDDAGDTPIPDAETAQDAAVTAAELAAAINPDGIVASNRRAELVYGAACARGKQCGAPSGVDPACLQLALGHYQDGVTAGYSDACLDSSLDEYGCIVTLPCDDFENANGCATFAEKIGPACGFDEDDGGI